MRGYPQKNKTRKERVTLKENAKKFLMDESGDTNFISIIIILGIVIVLAGVFILFREKIVNVVKGVIDGFSEDSLGNKGS